MFKKNKELKGLNELHSANQARLAQVEEKFAEIEGIADAGEKILKLQELQRSINNAEHRSSSKINHLSEQGSYKAGWKRGTTIMGGTTAAAVTASVLVAPPIAMVLFPAIFVSQWYGMI